MIPTAYKVHTLLRGMSKGSVGFQSLEREGSTCRNLQGLVLPDDSDSDSNVLVITATAVAR